jgi:branched-chain amino acid transport system permease protein
MTIPKGFGTFPEMTTLFTILFDGVAYGMLLFVLACGLAVTLGLMNFVNLAHGAFAMAGGYVCAVLVNQYGWPFFAGLPLAFVSSALIGVVLERSLYRHLYNRSHLDQVLFSVGLVFMSVAAVDYIMGSSRVFIKIPQALEGQIDFFGVGIGRYRLMIIVICGLLTAALQPAARCGGRPPRRQRPRHQRAAGVRLHLCVWMRPCRSGRRAECGDFGT